MIRNHSSGMARRAATGLVAALMLLLAPLTTAQASDPTSTADVQPSSVDPPSGCVDHWTLKRWGHTGKFPCSTYVLWKIWPDGHSEYFGIGTDWQVYHITAGTDGWKSMGGKATNVYHAYINDNGYATIAVVNVNADHQIWCKQYIYPIWVGWYARGPR